MQVQNQQKKKRKGISVSLTPNKQNQNIINNRPLSPPPQNIILHQSYAQIEEPQIFPKYVRVFTSYRAPDIPPVTFSYSNVSKDQEIREGLALDQELYLLKKQLQNKRQVVSNLQRERNVLITSNVTPGYGSTEENQRAFHHLPTPTTQIQSSFSPIIAAAPLVQPIMSTSTYTSPFKVSPKQASTALKFTQNIKVTPPSVSIPKQQKITHQITLIKQVPANPQKVGKNPETDYFNSTIKKQVKKEESPPKVQQNYNKQNNKKLSERIQKLKWAEQKLLDIINVCDHGL